MNTSDEYIIVESSKNLDGDEKDTETIENELDSERTLEKQGIFIEAGSDGKQSGDQNLDGFAQELKDVSGIEIMPPEEGDDMI